MWLLKYAVCLIKRHLFVAVRARGGDYQYCLRCGKLSVVTAGEEGSVAHDELASV